MTLINDLKSFLSDEIEIISAEDLSVVLLTPTQQNRDDLMDFLEASCGYKAKALSWNSILVTE